MYEELAKYLGPVFIAALGIFVVWWGYEMLFGRAPMTAGEFVWRFGRAFLTYTFIVSWAAYSPLVAKPLLEGPPAIAAVVCEAAGGANCGKDGASMGAGLKYIWTAAITGAKTIYARGGVTAPQFFIAALIVAMFAVFLCATAAVILIIGKMTMFILLAIGPIVLCAALFRFTSSVVDGWMKALAAYALLPVLVYTTLGLMTTILRSTIDAMQNGDAVFSTLCAFCFMCTATVYLLKEMVSLAAGIAGGAPRIDATGQSVRGYTSLLGLGAVQTGRAIYKNLPGRQSGTIGDGDAAAAQVRAASLNSRK
ncbi:type IV secretion system protein [Agrobacterium tumefaciens]|nr:type IV secretion system protein [Agrobacterium tumefaciens]